MHVEVSSDKLPENPTALIKKAKEQIGIAPGKEVIVILADRRMVNYYLRDNGEVLCWSKWSGWPDEEYEEDDRPYGWWWRTR